MPNWWRLLARCALVSTSVVLAASRPAMAEDRIIAASYGGETRAYDHGVLGDAIEYTELRIVTEAASGARREHRFSAPEGHVFEDVAPRLWQVDGLGGPEVVVVLTHMRKGASLAVFAADGMISRTPYIGRKNRWLAPVGAADLDGDGRIEIAYVDRPHLAKVVKLWRWQAGALVHVADIPGFSNHRIGWSGIPGGVRDCGQGAEMVLADAEWRNVVALRWDGNTAQARRLRGFDGARSIDQALRCK